MSLNDAEHQDRVRRLRIQLLDLLAHAENDPMIFPGGLPEDPAELITVTSLLNADALGNVLGCTFLAHYMDIGPDHAQHWLAQMLSIFVGLVKRDAPEAGLDFSQLAKVAADLDANPAVPDALPEDFDA